MSSKHSVLSPSSAERWLACPPSAQLCAQVEDGETSSYAEEGKLAHTIAEKLILEQDLTAAELEHPAFYTDMLEELQDYVNYCKRIIDRIETKEQGGYAVEHKVDLSDVAENTSGTCDFCAVHDGVLFICDLKFGRGVPVSAKNNKQLMLYAYGVYKNVKDICKYPTYPIFTISLNIFQPRLNSHSYFNIAIKNLEKWIEKIKPIAQQAFNGEGEFAAGEHCRFCKVKGACKVYAKEGLKILEQEDKEPDLFTTPELAEFLKSAKKYKDWIAAAEMEFEKRVKNGEKVEGFALKPSFGNRTWADEEEVKSVLSVLFPSEYFLKTELKSVAQLEKQIGKKKLGEICQDLIFRPSRGFKVVAENEDLSDDF